MTIDAQNGWTDMVATYAINMVDGETTYVTPCNKTLGAPPVANVMVIGGGSIGASTFEGTDPTDPATGCMRSREVQHPGTIAYQGGFRVVPGNANGDTKLDIADAIWILNFLFRGGPSLPCEKAAM